MGWFHAGQTSLHSLRFLHGLFCLVLVLTSSHSSVSPLSLVGVRVCSWEVNRRLNVLDPASKISAMNTVGSEQEMCSALPWICFSYLYIGNCLNSHILLYQYSSLPPHCTEFLRYQISKNCRHGVLSHLLVKAQSRVCMRMRRNLC